MIWARMPLGRRQRTNGQYDSKTFEVRARPLEKVADLRPGMSVILKKKGKEIV